ncbi:unnamed protein product, partial [Rotaria sp. Silwood2]
MNNNIRSSNQKKNLNTVHHIYIDDEKKTTNCTYYFPNVTFLTFSDGLG